MFGCLLGVILKALYFQDATSILGFKGFFSK